jgi:hypothetical protein
LPKQPELLILFTNIDELEYLNISEEAYVDSHGEGYHYQERKQILTTNLGGIVQSKVSGQIVSIVDKPINWSKCE